jgi:hypothetical protein
VAFEDGKNANKLDSGLAFFWGENKQDASGADYRRLFDTERGYDEVRVYLLQSLTKRLSMSLDAMGTFLNTPVNGEASSLWGQAALEARLTKNLSIVGAGSWSTNPYLTNDVRGIFKLAYNAERNFGRQSPGEAAH